MDVFIGVDPGHKSGAYTIAVEKSKNMIAYRLDDMASFLEHLHEYKDFHRRIILEEIPYYVGRDIPSSTGVKLGYSAGLVAGIGLGERIPVHTVKPKEWQAGFAGLRGTKGAERKRILRGHATRLYPHLRPTLRTADAILLTHYFINNPS